MKTHDHTYPQWHHNTTESNPRQHKLPKRKTPATVAVAIIAIFNPKYKIVLL